MENKNNINCLNYANMITKIQTLEVPIIPVPGFCSGNWQVYATTAETDIGTIRPTDGHLMDSEFICTFPNIVRRQILTGSLSLYPHANGRSAIALTGYKLL